MNIVIQKTSDRDAVGIINALIADRHNINIWNHEEQELREFNPHLIDLLIITDPNLGQRVKNSIEKRTKVLFLKCKTFNDFRTTNVYSIGSLPYCADDKRYPPNFYNKDYASDVLYISTFTHNNDRLKILDRISKKLKFWIVGTTVESTNYIGGITTPHQLSQFCLSSAICIDFDFDYALDLAKIGCNVITNKENPLDIPIYNESNLEEVILREIEKERPITNPFDLSIITYSHFLKHLYRVIEI